MSVDKFIQLTKQIDSLRSDYDKNRGELAALKKQLLNEFNCKSIADAKRLLKKLDDELARLENHFECVLSDFENKWEHLLDESN